MEIKRIGNLEARVHSPENIAGEDLYAFHLHRVHDGNVAESSFETLYIDSDDDLAMDETFAELTDILFEVISAADWTTSARAKPYVYASKDIGEYGVLRVTIDQYPLHPRRDTDTLSKIWAKSAIHRDEEYEGITDPDDFMDSLDPEDDIRDLFMYQHGMVALSLSPYSDPWDSGQIGFLVVSKDNIALIGTPAERVEAVIEAEIQEFEQYLNGQVYVVNMHRKVDGDVLETEESSVNNVYEDSFDEVLYDLLEGPTLKTAQSMDWTY